MRLFRSALPSFGPTATVAFLAAALILFLGGWQIMRTRDALLADAEQNVRNLSLSLAQHAARTIEGVDLVLSGAVERTEGNPDRTRLSGFLQQRANNVAQLRRLVVTDAGGTWIADTLPPHAPVDGSDGPDFVWHRDHDDRNLHIDALRISRYDGRPAIPLSRRLNTADGAFAGEVVASLSPEYFLAFYETFNIGAHGAVALWSDDGRVLVRHPAASKTGDQASAPIAGAAQSFKARSGAFRSRSPIDGVDRIVAFEHVERYPFLVSAAIAVDDALASWIREAWMEGLAVGAAAVALVTLGFGLEQHRRHGEAIERASREINRQYRLLAENSSDFITLKPTFAGARTYVSPSCKAIVGWEPWELITLPTEAFIHPDDLDRVAAEFASLTPARPRVTSVHRVRHKAGHFIWLEAVLTLTDDRSVIVASRDVTARCAAEQALSESEARYRLLAHNTTDMITHMDLTGRRLFVSPGSRELLGYDPEDLVGSNPQQMIHPDDAFGLELVFADLASARLERAVNVNRLRHKNGRWIWVEASLKLLRTDDGRPAGFVGAIRSIMDRRRTDEALRESEARYRLLADHSSDLIALKPTFEGPRAYVSPSSRAVIGYEPDEFAALPVSEYVHPEDRERVAAEFASLTLENPEITSLHRVRHKVGHWIWIEVDFRLTNAGKADQNVIIRARDVTARYEAQQALIESEARYRLLADASSDMVQRLDLNGRRRYVSPAAFEILGFEGTDLVGTHPVDFIHPDDSGRVGGLIDDLTKGQRDRARSTHRVRHKASHWVWVEAQFRLVRDKTTGEPVEIVSNLRDVTKREMLQHRLSEANRLLLMAEEIAHVGHWRVELPGNILTWSDEVYKIHGLDPNSFTPCVETAIDLYHPDDRAQVTRCVTDAIASLQSYEFNLRILRPDGEARHVLSRGLCEIDAETGELRAIFGTIMDMTELAQAERRVTEKSALLEATLDNMDQALIKVAQDGTIELVNRRFAELLDLPPDLLAKPRPNFEDVLDYLTASGEYARTDPKFRAYIGQRGAPLTLGTYERSRPNGTVLEVRTVPVPDGAVIRTYADITARRQAELALKEAEARWSFALDNSGQGVWDTDIEQKRSFYSPSWKALIGYAEDEIGADPMVWLDLMHPDDRQAALQADLDHREGRTEYFDGEFRMRHKSGHWIWIHDRGKVIRYDANGRALRMIGTHTDITARKNTERELLIAKAAAEQAARAKAEFLANMSHELRTPLTGMLGVHDLLGRDPKLSDAQRRLIGLAGESGRSLLTIVNDILDFSKIDAGRLTIENLPFNLQFIVESCRDLAAEDLKGKPVRIDATFSPAQPGWVVGDPTRLRQILLNLLTNAVKFTERGRIEIDVVYRAETATLRIDVADTGIGIPLDKAASLFERFTQADASVSRRYGGTGLGLAICKRLLDLMGGSIGVDARAEGGSKFWFELPLMRYDGKISGAASVDVGPKPGVSRRILLAEDNPINSEIIATMLTDRGHAVTTVSDGKAAVHAAKSGVDLVLMDLQMPVMDGLAATAAIRRDEVSDGRRQTPIIGLTANAMIEDVQHCLAAGMDAHVAKPIEWSALFAVMDRLLPTAEALNPAHHKLDKGSRILDETMLETLSKMIGRGRLADILSRFVTDLQRRIASLDEATPTDIATHVHSLASISGQLGFAHLSDLCIMMEKDIREGGGGDHIAALREAAKHATLAAMSCDYARAA